MINNIDINDKYIYNAAVTQLVECLICNQGVADASSASGSNFKHYSPVAKLVSRMFVTHKIVGSCPTWGANFK